MLHADVPAEHPVFQVGVVKDCTYGSCESPNCSLTSSCGKEKYVYNNIIIVLLVLGFALRASVLLRFTLVSQLTAE